MNLKPDTMAITDSLGSIEQQQHEDVNEICQLTLGHEEEIISSDFVSKKRKRNQVTLPYNFNANLVIDEEEISNDNFMTNFNLSGKIHASVQCPERSDSPSHKKIKSYGKSELKNLRIQFAMISDGDGDRPIHVAVAQENLKLVRQLCALMLKAAISLDITNYLRQTPLHLAVMIGNPEMVVLLLKCGATVTLRDRNGNSVIHLAVKTNTKQNILSLILAHPQSKTILNSLDYEGYSALHYSVLKDSKTSVVCLHRAGAQMNIIDGKSGRSALIHAILEQNVAMVSLLLECGASAEVSDYSGRSAFDLALQTSNKNIIKLLEKRLFFDEDTTATMPMDNNVFPVLNISSQSDKRSSRTKRTNNNKRKK